MRWLCESIFSPSPIEHMKALKLEAHSCFPPQISATFTSVFENDRVRDGVSQRVDVNSPVCVTATVFVASWNSEQNELHSHRET